MESAQSSPSSVSSSVSGTPAVGDNTFQINKCARFFKTLIHLAANKPGAYTVKLAIRDILSGTMSPETFTVKLQEGLQSEAQKNLLPFLRSHLMTLRGALQNEYLPTRYTEVAALKNLMKSEGLEIMTGQSSNLPHPGIVYPQTQSTVYATNSRSPGDHLVHQHIPSTIFVRPVPSMQNGGAQIQSFANFQPISILNQSQTFDDDSLDPAIMDMRMETTSPTSGKIDASIEGVVRSCSSTAPAPSTCAVPVPQPPPRPQAKIQLVNFDRTKESQMLINHNALITRIREKMPGAERFDMEMLALISEATEARLRTIISRLSVMAEHRNDPLRLNSSYKQIDDPRRQLRFVEDIDKSANAKREASEKEALLKLTKSKGKDKDTREKVKEIQRADREATANRDTNAAAFAALGGMRTGLKRTNQDGQQTNGMGSVGGAQSNRPRMKRIAMRDLQYLIHNDKTLNFNPRIKQRVVLASLNIDDSIFAP